MLRTEHFKYVIELARAGTISRAAENLFISQPYLSLELKNLEQQLGVTLFERSSKGITLTRAGEQFLAYARDICRIEEKAAHIRDFYSNETENLKISCMYSFTMMDLYDAFAARCSQYECTSYDECPNEEIAGRVYRGDCHLGLLYVASSRLHRVSLGFADHGLDFIPLVDEPLSAVFSRKHPLAGRPSVRCDELAGLPTLSKQLRPGRRNPFVPYVPDQIQPQIAGEQPIHTDNTRSILYYVTRHPEYHSFGQKALNLTSPFVASGEIVYVPIEDAGESLVTGCLINRKLPASRLQTRFVQMLQEYFARYSASGTAPEEFFPPEE